MYRTRAAMKKEQEEAANILVQLSETPVLRRTLSHQYRVYELAMEIAPQTKPGDTILMNYFTDSNGMTNLEYMMNEDGKMVVYHIDAHRELITIEWTYQVTDFPF